MPTPDNPKHPLGRIVVGNNTSARLLSFIESQEVQPVIQIPTEWLRVGHVDEIVSFGHAGKTVYVADPTEAYKLLEAIPADDRGAAVFFSIGSTKTGSVPAASPVKPGTRIETGMNLVGGKWKYIRIYQESVTPDDRRESHVGQIARISKLGDGYVEVDRVWFTGSAVVPDSDPEKPFATLMEVGRRTWTLDLEFRVKNIWFNNPQAGDKFVLLEDTRMNEPDASSNRAFPMAVTVAEVLADKNFDKVNRTLIKKEIEKVEILVKAAGGVDKLNFVPLPVLFFGKESKKDFSATSTTAQVIGDFLDVTIVPTDT